jgi:hypothetical protein
MFSQGEYVHWLKWMSPTSSLDGVHTMRKHRHAENREYEVNVKLSSESQRWSCTQLLGCTCCSDTPIGSGLGWTIVSPERDTFEISKATSLISVDFTTTISQSLNKRQSWTLESKT